MSDSNQKEKKPPRVRDIQEQIVKIMLRRNPDCTVSEVGRNYENLKKYLMGEDR